MPEEKSDPMEALLSSLLKLKLDYVDLYLVHWPQSNYLQETDSWERQPMHIVWGVLEQAVEKGLVRSLGVSNFNCQSMLELLTYCEVKPVVNQIELHPYLPQSNLLAFMKRVGIHAMAYAPLGSPGAKGIVPNKESKNLLEDPLVLALAEKYEKTAG